ncbi:MAG: hypothetical protein JNM93_07755 [Bacteriovoracaceae bacterium]|nr:hypothetical protein [Bacteriovoracaceae bacterium]
MIVNVFDYVEKLENSGFSKNQAEASLQVLMDIMNQEFATKHDLKEAVNELRQELVKTETGLRLEISEVRTDIKLLRQEMYALGDKLTIRIGAIVTAGLALSLTIIQLMK